MVVDNAGVRRITRAVQERRRARPELPGTSEQKD